MTAAAGLLSRLRVGVLILGAIVVAGTVGYRLLFNPSADTVFQPEDIVIAMGKIEDIERFRTEYGV